MFTAYDYSTDFASFETNSARKLLESNEQVLIMKAKALLTESQELMVLSEEAEKKNEKGFFKRILEKLKEIWMRFLATMKRLDKINNVWLKKYREAILKTDVSKMEYEIAPYSKGVRYINEARIPNVNLNSPQFQNAGDDRTKMFQLFFGGGFTGEVKKVMTTNKDINEAKAFQLVFKGGPKQKMSGNELKLEIVKGLDFCLQYGQIHTKISSDHKNIEKLSKLTEAQWEQTMKNSGKDAIEKKQDAADKALEGKEDKQADKGGALKVGESAILLGEEDSAYGKKVSAENKSVETSFSGKTIGQGDNKGTASSQEKAKGAKMAISLFLAVMAAKLSAIEDRYTETIKLLRLLAKKAKGADNAQQTVDKGNEEIETQKTADKIANQKKSTIKKITEKTRKGVKGVKTGTKRLFGKAVDKVKAIRSDTMKVD